MVGLLCRVHWGDEGASRAAHPATLASHVSLKAYYFHVQPHPQVFGPHPLV